MNKEGFEIIAKERGWILLRGKDWNDIWSDNRSSRLYLTKQDCPIWVTFTNDILDDAIISNSIPEPG
jgi:hypothetical protein